MKQSTIIKAELIYFVIVVILMLILFLSCESPTAPHKDRTKQTEIIRNDNGRY